MPIPKDTKEDIDKVSHRDYWLNPMVAWLMIWRGYIYQQVKKSYIYKDGTVKHEYYLKKVDL